MATAAELEVVMRADVTQATAALKRVERQLNQTTKAGKGTEKGMKGLSGGFAGMMQGGAGAALKMAGAASAVIAVGLAMKHGISQALKWETALTGVAKTVSGTDVEIAALGHSLTRMATTIPVAREELAKLAQVSGQLGVQTQNLKLYVETAAQLGVAVDDLTPEEAIVGLTKFGNVMGTNQKDIAKLASAVVDLGNNFATTEGTILNMGQRMAAAGRIIGLSEGDVLGLATALSSVGINAESGGTAFSRVMIEISKAASEGGTQLEEMARLAGMTAEEFQHVTRTTPVEAIKKFVVGLKNAQDRGENVFKTLEGLGMNSVRLQQALLSASSATGMFTSAIMKGNEAFEEGTALQAEAQRAFGTTQAKLDMLGNTFDAVSGEAMKSFLPVIGGIAEGLTTAMAALFLPTEKVVDVFSKFPKAVEETVEPAKKLANEIDETGDKMEDLITQIDGSINIFGAFAVTSTDVEHAMDTTGKSMSELKEFLVEARTNAVTWRTTWEGALAVMAAHNRPLETHVGLVGDLADELEDLDVRTKEFMPTITAYAAAIERARERTKELREAKALAAEGDNRLKELQDELASAVVITNKAFNVHEARLWEVRRAMNETTLAVQAAEGEFGEFGSQVEMTLAALFKNTKEMFAYIKAAKSFSAASADMEDELHQVETELNRLTDTTTEYRRINSNATDSMDEAAEGLERILDRTVVNNIPARDQVAINREVATTTNEAAEATQRYSSVVDTATTESRNFHSAQRDIESALRATGLEGDLLTSALTELGIFGIQPATDMWEDMRSAMIEFGTVGEQEIDTIINKLKSLVQQQEKVAETAPGSSEAFAAAQQTALQRGRDVAYRVAERRARGSGLPAANQIFELDKSRQWLNQASNEQVKAFFAGTAGGVSFGQGRSAGALGISVPQLQQGGIVRAPTLAMIGEGGPEAVVPLRGNGGIGGASVVVNVQGNLLTEHDLQQMILRTVQDGLRGGSFSHIERSLVPQLQ